MVSARTPSDADRKLRKHTKTRTGPHGKQHPRYTPVDLIEVERTLYKKSFRDFIPDAFEVLEGGDVWLEAVLSGKKPRRFVGNWHIDAMAEHLQAVTMGQITRLLINIPPGAMKSQMTCVLWPAWYWALDPEKRSIFSSYSEEFTKRDARKTKALIKSAWYQRLFPHVQIATAPDTQMEFHTTVGGERHGASTNSGVTGKHVHVIVEDDPIKLQDASSKRARDEAWEYHTQALGFRLLPEGGARVVVMQRLHEEDTSGRIISRRKDGADGEYVHLCLPMEFEPSRRCVTPLFTDPRQEEGDLLWPSRMDRAFVDRLKGPNGLGESGFAGQAQQRPSPAAGGIIKRHWWKHYRDPPTELDHLLISWDMTFKKSGSSWVVGQVWGRKGPNAYLLEQLRDKLDFPSTLAAVRRLAADWPAAKEKLIEDAANGPAVIATIKSEIPGVIPIPARGSKEERLSAVATYIEAGNVYLPSEDVAPWIAGYLEELSVFPNGANDDQCDATSQALARLFDPKHKPRELPALTLNASGLKESPWRL